MTSTAMTGVSRENTDLEHFEMDMKHNYRTRLHGEREGQPRPLVMAKSHKIVLSGRRIPISAKRLSPEQLKVDTEQFFGKFAARRTYNSAQATAAGPSSENRMVRTENTGLRHNISS